MGRRTSVDWLGERIRRREEAEATARRLRPRDSLVTLMLGTLSLGLGLAAFTSWIGGIAGGPSSWTEPYEVMAESNPPRYWYAWDPDLGEQVRLRVRVRAAIIPIPSAYCQASAWLGAALGGAGVAIGRRRRRLSYACLAGLVLGLLTPVGAFLYVLLMEVFH